MAARPRTVKAREALAARFSACLGRPVNAAPPSELLDILFEDNHLLVVNKPAGLLSQSAERGDDNLVTRAERDLKARYHKPGNVFVGLVHRLDRNTSGVVLLAKTSKAAERLAAALREGRLHKLYLAVVAGLTPASGELAHHLLVSEQGSRVVPASTPGAKPARLAYTRLATANTAQGAFSLLVVDLGTGRKHQIRVQLAAAGHPLVGDRRYGRREHDALLGRPALHAAKITFTHPVRQEETAIEAPIPDDFASLCRTFGWRVTRLGQNGG